MDPREATSIFNSASEVASTLHRDFEDFNEKLLQVEQHIERMKEMACRLKKIKNGVAMCDEDLDVDELVTTISEALNPLGKLITSLETKRDCLFLCISNINAAVRSANKLARKIRAIPRLN